MIIEQKFKTPIFLNDGQSVRQIDCRKWSHNGEEKMTVGKIENNEQEMGYMGSYQIREIWKYYRECLYISNLGYAARFENIDEAKKVFGHLFDKFAHGIAFEELNSTQKKYFREHIADLHNFYNNYPGDKRLEVMLKVNYKEGSNRGVKIHEAVAELFLEKPENAWGVHHIDNNSYNNSVTNLVWVKKEEHDKKLHPLTYK